MKTNSDRGITNSRSWKLIRRIAAWSCYICAPVIIIIHIYYILNKKFEIAFDLPSVLIGLLLDSIVLFIFLLIPLNKRIKIKIDQGKWDIWLSGHKYSFILSQFLKGIPVAVIVMTIYYYFKLYVFNKSINLDFSFYNILLIVISISVLFNIMIWDYKMKKRDTMRNKIINLFKGTPT